MDDCEVDVRARACTCRRIYEIPRVTKPYTDEQWAAHRRARAARSTRDLARGDVRLTMGGEPTFVSIDDMDGAEWNMAAARRREARAGRRAAAAAPRRFAPGGLLHFGQGKWYPGESLPRWALGCYWRRDGEPIWNDPQLIADEHVRLRHRRQRGAARSSTALAERSASIPSRVLPALRRRLVLPVARAAAAGRTSIRCRSQLDDAEERARLARIFERGSTRSVGYVLPLQRAASAARRAGRAGRGSCGPSTCS